MNYTIIASSLYGNKGAASMLEASIQTISAKDKSAKFTLLSLFPLEDLAQNNYSNLEIVSAKPLELLLVINPLALLYWLLPPFRSFLRKNQQIKVLSESDVFLDEGGITFVDGRQKPLIYNVASILPALFMRVPVVKCSQALGPFTETLNNKLANFFLPKMEVIYSRGQKTTDFLMGLKLTNIKPAADYGFLLSVTAKEKASADRILGGYTKKTPKSKKIIAIIPSEVVRAKFEKTGKDYINFNRKLINHSLGKGYSVVLIPHSARQGSNSRMNNDMLVCNVIARGIDDKAFVYIDKELSAQQLRQIISKMDAIVTSRFHAMVSGLATKTPSFIIGWSHKYTEVMDDFEVSDNAFDYSQMNLDDLFTRFDSFMSKLSATQKNIAKNLPAVLASASVQVDGIIEIASKRSNK